MTTGRTVGGSFTGAREESGQRWSAQVPASLPPHATEPFPVNNREECAFIQDRDRLSSRSLVSLLDRERRCGEDRDGNPCDPAESTGNS